MGESRDGANTTGRLKYDSSSQRMPSNFLLPETCCSTAEQLEVIGDIAVVLPGSFMFTVMLSEYI